MTLLSIVFFFVLIVGALLWLHSQLRNNSTYAALPFTLAWVFVAILAWNEAVTRMETTIAVKLTDQQVEELVDKLSTAIAQSNGCSDKEIAGLED